MLRDRRVDKPGAANNRLKYLSVILSWAVERNLMRANPCRDVKHLHYATDGYHTWSPDEVKQLEAHHKVGTKAHLALALMLYLRVRRGDAVRLGKQHVRNGAVHFVPNKTRHKKMDAIELLPVLPELARIIAASPCGELTFLMTEYGKPFTAHGFGLWFRARRDEAGLLRCSAHGLRKAPSSILAERGATDRQLMAMFEWESEKEATKYTKAAKRKRLAAAAMRLEDQNENSNCPAQLSHQKKLDLTISCKWCGSMTRTAIPRPRGPSAARG
jgi:integrase